MDCYPGARNRAVVVDERCKILIFVRARSFAVYARERNSDRLCPGTCQHPRPPTHMFSRLPVSTLTALAFCSRSVLRLRTVHILYRAPCAGSNASNRRARQCGRRDSVGARAAGPQTEQQITMRPPISAWCYDGDGVQGGAARRNVQAAARCAAPGRRCMSGPAA